MCWYSCLELKHRFTKYIYGSRLSHISDKPIVSVFQFDIPSISLNMLGISSSVSLSLSGKNWYNDYTCVTPRILHENYGLTTTKKILSFHVFILYRRIRFFLFLCHIHAVESSIVLDLFWFSRRTVFVYQHIDRTFLSFKLRGFYY